MSIKIEIINDKKYLSTVYRNVEYSLYYGGFGWCLHTRRLGYGGSLHFGTSRAFANLAAVAAACKAFGTLDDLIALNYFGAGVTA